MDLPQELESQYLGYFCDDRPAGIGTDRPSFERPPRCVVTGNPVSTVHHLNDIHSDDRLSNIVPLLSELNSQLGAHKRNQSAILNPQLTTDYLLAEAQQHFLGWRNPAAYACAHLAFQIARRYEKLKPSKQLPILTKAVYYARHAWRQDIILDLLVKPDNEVNDVGLLQLLQESGALDDPMASYSVIQELAAICNEDDDLDLARQARELMEYADHYFTIADRVRDDTVAKSRANFLRRDAHMRTAETAIGEVPSLLAEAGDLDPNRKIDLYTTEMFRRIALGDPRAGDVIDQYLAPAVEHYAKSQTQKPLRMTAAAAAGIFLFSGLLRNGRIDKHATDFFNKGLLIMKRSRHVLPRHYPDFWNQTIALFAPHLELEQIATLVGSLRPRLPESIKANIRTAINGPLRRRIAR